MEQHLSVREARRRFAELMSLAAFGDYRLVVVRYREEIGAFVNMDDLEFLRKFKPKDASGSALRALEEAARELDSRDFLLRGREALLRKIHAGEGDWAPVKAQREEIEKDRRQLIALAESFSEQRSRS